MAAACPSDAGLGTGITAEAGSARAPGSKIDFCYCDAFSWQEAYEIATADVSLISQKMLRHDSFCALYHDKATTPRIYFRS